MGKDLRRISYEGELRDCLIHKGSICRQEFKRVIESCLVKWPDLFVKKSQEQWQSLNFILHIAFFQSNQSEQLSFHSGNFEFILEHLSYLSFDSFLLRIAHPTLRTIYSSLAKRCLKSQCPINLPKQVLADVITINLANERLDKCSYRRILNLSQFFESFNRALLQVIHRDVGTQQVVNTGDSQLIFLFFALAFLVSLALDVDDLL